METIPIFLVNKRSFSLWCSDKGIEPEQEDDVLSCIRHLAFALEALAGLQRMGDGGTGLLPPWEAESAMQFLASLIRYLNGSIGHYDLYNDKTDMITI